MVTFPKHYTRVAAIQEKISLQQKVLFLAMVKLSSLSMDILQTKTLYFTTCKKAWIYMFITLKYSIWMLQTLWSLITSFAIISVMTLAPLIFDFLHYSFRIIKKQMNLLKLQSNRIFLKSLKKWLNLERNNWLQFQ
eukprot:NODE_161_length_14984_cov_0.487000.p9 type:complete len:136 gc:universal NODE_161_length_14984_cov_0.487000:11129-11536(+)